MKYKSLEESPTEINISVYWNTGTGVSYLRSGLPITHAEHTWNWFKRTYPDLNPALYDVKHPYYEKYKDMTRDELINRLLDKELQLEEAYKYL